MCGIAGFCNMPENWQENIKKMNDRMQHRGPDAEGIWANEDATVVFGHRRLSILDLSPSGAQPMISRSGRYVMVLNGEIYNFKQIAEKLLVEKFVTGFRGTSDTEVLLEACEVYGFEDTVKLTKGMFAIALYDRLEKKLFLARDRVGEKPLYYGFLKGKFVFASEISVIKENQYFTPDIDRDTLMLYFRYGYIPAPYTIFKNIHKLEAGSILKIEVPFSKTEVYKYWDITEVAKQGQKNLFRGTQEEAADKLEYLLKRAIQGQMVADVPVGAFLSGGIDSTTVVAIMQSVSSNKVKTFSIGFEDQEYDEAKHAKDTADFLGTSHTEMYVTDKEAMEVIPQLSHIYGEPFADSSQIPTYLVSKLAKEKVTVSLSGDGGDELFCGYNSYRIIQDIWKKIGKIPLPLRKTVSEFLIHTPLNEIKKFHSIGHYIKAQNIEQLYEWTGNATRGTNQIVKGANIPDFKYNLYPYGMLGKNSLDNIMLMDLLMYHPDDILAKVDRAGMAVSLESRIPLLDKDIVEFAWTLPLEFKYSDKVGKRVLKDVLYRYIPESMMDRPKRGFSVPVMKWIKSGELRSWAEELLGSDHIRSQGILDENIVKKMWQAFLKTDEASNQIWYLLMFEQWMREMGM